MLILLRTGMTLNQNKEKWAGNSEGQFIILQG